MKAGKQIILTPDSTQPINMTTEEDDVSTTDRKSFDGIKVSENLATTRDVKSDSIMTEGNSDVSRTITPDEDDLMSFNETHESNFENKEEVEEKQKEYDPDETIDCGEDVKESEISDNDGSTAENAKRENGEKSEISDIKPKKAIKQLGSNGPVVVLKLLPKQDEYIVQTMEKEENVKYKSISAVKLGCNRCTEVFYSEGGYNDHLFTKHRVRDVLRNPPTVINRLWSRIPKRQPLFEGQNECEICGARYFDKLFYYRHVQTCKKLTVHEFEEKQHDLHVVLERNQKEDNEKEVCAEIVNENEKDVISPSQPKKARHSRSRKRNWTTTKRRRRQKSGSCPVPSKRYVKSQVESQDLSKSDDRKENVEFYEQLENAKEKKENKNQQCTGEVTALDSSTNTTSSAPSCHENDTDFKITKTPETSSCTTEESLPMIRRLKTRYQSLMEQKVTDAEKEKKKENDESSLKNTPDSDRDGKSQKSNNDKEKTEISDAMNDLSSKVDTQSEITDKSDRNEPSMQIDANTIDISKSGKGTSGKNKGNDVTSKNKVDAYMKERKRKRQVEEKNEDASGNESEISDSTRRMQTRSQIQLPDVDKNEAKGDDTKSASEKEDEEEEDYFSCKICSQTFKNHTMLKKHKVLCTKIKKKHCFSKCGKSFS